MYEKILEAWRREARNQALQPIGPNFYSEIRQYISELEGSLKISATSPLNLKLMEEEIRRIRMLAEELVDLRFKKMMKEAQDGSLPVTDIKNQDELKMAAMLGEVKAIADKLKDTSLMERPLTRHGEDKTVIRMLQPIKRIVCVDMKAYGPFEAEDVVYLPKNNADILVERGIAARIDAKA